MAARRLARAVHGAATAVDAEANTIAKKIRSKRIVVFGSGSFGTAMGTVLARNGCNVTILTRKESVRDYINSNHRNPGYLTQYPLPFNVRAESDPEVALRSGVDFILHSIPVQSTADFLHGVRDLIPESVPIINTSKGLETSSLRLMSAIIPEALGRASHPYAVVSGPTFAKELMEAWPTGALVASADASLAAAAADLFASPNVRLWTSQDVVGVEVSGALKNVYAIASGMIEGLGLGLNTTSLLVTRAVAEMNRLALALGANSHTLVGLSGIGDLMLTSYGGLSRNRTVGMRLGRGESLTQVMESMSEAAEGVATTPAALALARKHGVSVPIIESVDAVIKGLITPVDALMGLMILSPDGSAEGDRSENILAGGGD